MSTTMVWQIIITILCYVYDNVDVNMHAKLSASQAKDRDQEHD